MYTVMASVRRGFGLLLFALIVFFNGCSTQNTSKVATSSSPAALTPQPDGMRSGSEWPSYNGGDNETRFSSLSQINTGNVASLPQLSSLVQC